MQTKLFVGNLSYNATDTDLKALFEKHGVVRTVDIVKDRYTGQPRGFAFVEMASADDAQKCLVLNGTEFLGRNLSVSEARPPKQREWGGGGGGGRSRGNSDRPRRHGNW